MLVCKMSYESKYDVFVNFWNLLKIVILFFHFLLVVTPFGLVIECVSWVFSWHNVFVLAQLGRWVFFCSRIYFTYTQLELPCSWTHCNPQLQCAVDQTLSYLDVLHFFPSSSNHLRAFFFAIVAFFLLTVDFSDTAICEGTVVL